MYGAVYSHSKRVRMAKRRQCPTTELTSGESVDRLPLNDNRACNLVPAYLHAHSQKELVDFIPQSVEELDRESEHGRRALLSVPDNMRACKPHEQSMEFGYVADDLDRVQAYARTFGTAGLLCRVSSRARSMRSGRK